MKIKKCLFITLFIFFHFQSYCIIDYPKKYFISFLPQYLSKKGLRLDGEKGLDEFNALILSAYFYNGAESGYSKINNFQVTTNIGGWGTGLTYKRYLYHKGEIVNTPVVKTYVATGLNYQAFNLSYENETADFYSSNGINFIKYSIKEENQKIDRIGFNLIMGVNVVTSYRIFFEFFLGAGYNYSFIKDDSLKPRDFSSGITNYAYSGPIFSGGIKAGFYI